ncbi:MAG: hypothetical protein PUI76_01230 [Mollicutes bacterium]|nr:hypothetical protein [Mollicutes bacterium]
MKGNSILFSSYSGRYIGDSPEGCSSSLHGESQPYQDEYSVYSKMVKRDIKHGVYKLGFGYSQNPTSQNLSTLVNGNYIGNKLLNKEVPYVITSKGEVIIGDRNGNGRIGLPTPHPTFIGGIDPKVRMAGILKIRGGKIYSYDDRSGHYRPNIKSMKWADEAFAKYPKSKQFKNGEYHGK